MRTVLCYGDSNTWGRIPATSFNDARRYASHERWTGILRKELGDNFCVIEEGLRGRTTVWDDPVEGIHKNGFTYLLPCLQSHQPVDIVVLMLGTNDLKMRFSVPAQDIAFGAGNLVKLIKQSDTGPKSQSPHVLLVAPPPVAKLTLLAEQFEGATEKSKKLGEHYRFVANQHDCSFLDAAEVIVSSDIDGIHLEISEHEKLGKRVAEIITGIFQRNLAGTLNPST